MALDIMVASNVLSYPMLIFMKEQGTIVGRGGACPQTSGETKPALGRRARQSLPPEVGRGGVQPSGVGRGGASPQGSGEAESTFGRWARSLVAFLSDRKHQRLMVISPTSLGIPVLGPRQR